MKIYTKTGDDGTTSLFDGKRVLKDDARVDLYGDIDELNGCVGLAAAFLSECDLQKKLFEIQKDLFALGAKLANPTERKQKSKSDFEEDKVTALELDIDRMELSLKPMTSFILPGGSQAAATLHLARCICRRAERKFVALNRVEPLGDIYLHYLNRLSDHLFVAARYANVIAKRDDVPW